MRALTAALLIASAPALAAPPDNASPLKSQFTTIELDTCAKLKTEAGKRVWSCSGLAGYQIYIAEVGQRIAMSFGPSAEGQRAASQTLQAHNSLFRDKRHRITVEWRYVRRNGRDLPYATIVRYFTTRDGARGQVLVVTRISENEACRLGHIDALANPDAIALARSLADELARTFDCKNEPKSYGATGKSPM